MGAQQTIPKGARRPPGAKLVRGTLDASDNCISSQCAVVVPDVLGLDAPPPAPAPAPQPVPPPQTPAAPGETTVIDPVPAPEWAPAQPMQTGVVDKCALGLCADTEVSGVPGRTVETGGLSAQAFAMPGSSFGARRMFQVADEVHGGPHRTVDQMNTMWDTAAVQAMRRSEEYAQYVASLRPVFGDAADAVATSNMASASGLSGQYVGTQMFGQDAKARHGRAGQIQASALLLGDDTQARAAAMMDPAAFGGVVTTFDSNGRPVQQMLDPDGQSYTTADNVTPYAASPADLLSVQHAGAAGYLKDMDNAKKTRQALAIATGRQQSALDVQELRNTGAGDRVRMRQATVLEKLRADSLARAEALKARVAMSADAEAGRNQRSTARDAATIEAAKLRATGGTASSGRRLY